MAIYQYNGLMLPHSSREQSEMGVHVSKGNLEKGDLVFFNTNNSGKVSHVGVYIGNGRFIHAPGAGRRSASTRSTASTTASITRADVHCCERLTRWCGDR